MCFIVVAHPAGIQPLLSALLGAVQPSSHGRRLAPLFQRQPLLDSASQLPVAGLLERVWNEAEPMPWWSGAVRIVLERNLLRIDLIWLAVLNILCFLRCLVD